MKFGLSLGLVSLMMLGATHAMAASTERIKRTDRIQFTQPKSMVYVKNDAFIQRNDHIKFKKVVTTDVNKFSDRQKHIRVQRTDRIYVMQTFRS